MAETYHCSNCGATVERDFSVRSIVRTCDECGENGPFLNESLVESLETVAETDRPERWEEMGLEARFRWALREGFIQFTRGE